jgi:hypothetical protein
VLLKALLAAALPLQPLCLLGTCTSLGLKTFCALCLGPFCRALLGGGPFC